MGGSPHTSLHSSNSRCPSALNLLPLSATPLAFDLVPPPHVPYIGTGKTFLLNRIIEELRARYGREFSAKVALAAPTGIAATHIQGEQGRVVQVGGGACRMSHGSGCITTSLLQPSRHQQQQDAQKLPFALLVLGRCR